MKGYPTNTLYCTKALRRSGTEILVGHIFIPVLSLTSVLICLLPNHTGIPAWVVFLVNILLTLQIVGLQHELIHEPKSRTNWNLLLRLNLHVYSPFTPGFEEYRRLHWLHHQYENTENDPDYPMVRGSRLRAAVILAFAPEYWFFYAIRYNLVSQEFWPLYAFRLTVWFAYVAIIGLENYVLLFLLPAKIALALGFTVFSYECHTDNAGRRRGTTNLRARFPSIHKLIKFLIGPYSYNSSHFHAVHHAYPWISGRKLGIIRENRYGSMPEFPTRMSLF